MAECVANMPGRGCRGGGATNDTTAHWYEVQQSCQRPGGLSYQGFLLFIVHKGVRWVCSVLHLLKHYSLQCRVLRSASGLLAPSSLSSPGKKWVSLQRNSVFLCLNGCLKMRGFVPQGLPGLCCHCVGYLAWGRAELAVLKVSEPPICCQPKSKITQPFLPAQALGH